VYYPKESTRHAGTSRSEQLSEERIHREPALSPPTGR